MKRFLAIILALLLLFTLTGCSALPVILEALVEANTAPPASTPIPDLVLYEPEAEQAEQTPVPTDPAPETAAPNSVPDEKGEYDSKDEVTAYIAAYGRLPSNYITKAEARKLGWEGGSLERFAPGKCIGGDRFGNYEGLLPERNGRTYTECDIDTLGSSSRGAKRIVFSNDGLVYYTDDHYDSFTLLYGEE